MLVRPNNYSSFFLMFSDTYKYHRSIELVKKEAYESKCVKFPIKADII